MKLKDSMLINSGVKKNKSFLMEDVGVSTIELKIMSRAINNITSFIESVEWTLQDAGIIKRENQSPTPYPQQPRSIDKLNDEQKKQLKEKLKIFYFQKIDYMKEALEEMFGEKKEEEKEKEEEEEKEEPETEVKVYYSGDMPASRLY